MAALLASLTRLPPALAILALAGTAFGAEPGDRHVWRIEMDAAFIDRDSDYGAWTDGGIGKLRYGDDGMNAARLFFEYHGRIAPTLSTTVIADYVSDASAGLDLTEAFIDWRPIPKSRNQQQVRFGAFYPPLSLENVEPGWQSPYSYSYSAINTWLGEEIRPIGAEWSLRRRLGFAGSPQELRTFAAGFYGNDPAGTLLFWRGWSLHDRQSRLNDRLPMPPMPIWNWSGDIVGVREQSLEPFEEIDHKPGAYAGVEWRYARRVLLQLAYYDNGADPEAFSDGQWAWGTTFTQLALQVSLPWDLGLMAQWMSGETYWIAGAAADGTLSPGSELVEDGFNSNFAMLSRVFREAHRLSLRYDHFEMSREEDEPRLRSDDGHAWTFAYRYESSARLSAGFEYLRIQSRRDVWPYFYSAPEHATERELRVQVGVHLGGARSR